MTGWLPDLTRTRPRAIRAIADAWPPTSPTAGWPNGQRLPTIAISAVQLHVTVGTISRAYGEAERRGLIGGEIGRGTFVRARGGPARSRRAAARGRRSISALTPSQRTEAAALPRPLAELAPRSGARPAARLSCRMSGPEHRAAAARLLGNFELDVSPERIVAGLGAQQRHVAALTALAHPGRHHRVRAADLRRHQKR